MVGIWKNFGNYWVAGLIFAVITGTINTITSIISRYQPDIQPLWVWGAVTAIVGVALFILVPWIYGHLIEIIYIKFIKH